MYRQPHPPVNPLRASLQFRYLQTLVEMASEQNATILPIPMDIVREFARATAEMAGGNSYG